MSYIIRFLNTVLERAEDLRKSDDVLSNIPDSRHGGGGMTSLELSQAIAKSKELFQLDQSEH